MKRQAKAATPSEHELECRTVYLWTIRSDFDRAMETGTLDPDTRAALIAYLKSLSRPSKQTRRVEMAKAYIQERFARTKKPVSAAVIVKYLNEDKTILILGNKRFFSPGLNVSRDIVKNHIFPLLHQDKGFSLVGKGPARGWIPVA